MLPLPFPAEKAEAPAGGKGKKPGVHPPSKDLFPTGGCCMASHTVSVDFGSGGKLKAQSLKPVLSHNFRRQLLAKEQIRENVDETRSPGNVYWVNPRWETPDGLPDVEAAMTALKTDERKIRPDAVLVQSLVFQASPDWCFPKIAAEGWTDKEIEHSSYEQRGQVDRDRVTAWAQDVQTWLHEKWGDRLLATELHMDEASPHLHVQVLPVTDDGRLSAKELLGGKTGAKKFVSELAQVSAPHGLQRATEGNLSTGDIAQWRRKQEAAIKAAEAEKPAELKRLPEIISRPWGPPAPKPGLWTKIKAKLSGDEDPQQKWEQEEARRIQEGQAKRLEYLNNQQQQAFLASMAAKEARMEARDLKTENAALKRQLQEQQDRQRRDQLRSLPPEQVLEALGAHCVEGKPGGKTSQWILGDRKLAVTVVSPGNTCVFVDNHDPQHCKGRGNFDLVQQVRGCQFAEAASWMEDHFGREHALAEWHTSPGVQASRERALTRTPPPPAPAPPPVAANSQAVERYLTRARGVSPATIRHLLQTGQIYADANSNLVIPREKDGAFLRGTGEGSSWKRTVGGKSCGPARLVGPKMTDELPHDVILCEGVTDAVALVELNPEAEVMVVGGNLRPELKIRECDKVILAFDGDAGGQEHATHYKASLGAHRGGIYERKVPEGYKDWSEYNKGANKAQAESRSESQGVSYAPRPGR